MEKERKWKRRDVLIKGSINDYLEELIIEQLELGNTLKVSVGSDSQKNGKGYNYATAIVLEIKEFMGLNKRGQKTYKGKGAMVVSATYYEATVTKIGESRRMPKEVLNERMAKEVQNTVEVGYEIQPLILKYNLEFELHADINKNPKHGSNVSLNAAVGYLSGFDCEVKTKPDAYAASSGADKFC